MRNDVLFLADEISWKILKNHLVLETNVDCWKYIYLEYKDFSFPIDVARGK